MTAAEAMAEYESVAAEIAALEIRRRDLILRANTLRSVVATATGLSGARVRYSLRPRTFDGSSALLFLGTEPMRVCDIARMAGVSRQAAHQAVWKGVNAGSIRKVGHGRFVAIPSNGAAS